MLQNDVDITDLTSFGIKTRAAAYGAFKTVDELDALLREANALAYASQPLVLGGGSNMLFTRNYPGVILHNQVPGIEEELLPDDKVALTCGGGVNWHQLVMHCVKNNYGGIENLALIPGSCGAAPIQNIGAYGVELTDVFHSLQAFHLYDKSMQLFTHADCNFGYRNSVFKGKFKNQFAICSVTLVLSTNPRLNLNYAALRDHLNKHTSGHPGIAEVAEAVISIRQSKLPDPKKTGNAGSFFKNPVISAEAFQTIRETYPAIPHFTNSNGEIKLPAAWLIEQCGWKGYRQNDAGVHPRQALVLVNYGNASGAELYELSERILQNVVQRFGIELEREVNII